MIFWALGISISLGVLVLTAAMRPAGVHMAYLHMAVTAAMSLNFALLYIREHDTLRMAKAKPTEIAANTARFLSIVWTWGALAIGITYGGGILIWREWHLFFIAFCAFAGLCMYFSIALTNDARQDREDPTLARLGRYLTIAQLVGMLITMAGLVIDGKMTRFINSRFTDWAANDVFFFGALAIALISGYALLMKPQASSARAAQPAE